MIAGGGTGGHAYPAIALARVLMGGGWDVLFVGSSGGIEERLASEHGIPFEGVKVTGRRRGLSAANLLVAARLGRAFWRSLGIVGSFDPDVVVGTGGYVSLAPALASFVHRIPLVVHEQNFVPGLANRIASKLARVVAISFPGSEVHFGSKARLVGNPVRPEIARLNRAEVRPEAFRHFDLAPGRRTLLVAGGSQGAASLNETLLSLYDTWRQSEQLQVLHLVGERNYAEAVPSLESMRAPEDLVVWRMVPFTDRMDLAYAAADLAVSRAGASTIAEMAAVGLPAILVPYPHALDDDQRHNAEAAAAAGGAEIVADQDLVVRLGPVVGEVLFDEERLAAMGVSMRSISFPGATETLADLVTEVAGHTISMSHRPGREERSGPGGGRLPPNWKRVHMVGIGGVGMSAIARVLRAAGVQVSGSDIQDSTGIAALRQIGALVSVGHRGEAALGADVVVCSAAVGEDNVEIEAAKSLGIPVLSRGEALTSILDDLRVISIGGTHGKSTTSAMVASIFETAGEDPTYLIGAELTGGRPGGKLGDGAFAIVEADEAYGSFLHLHSEVALVGNIDSDHLDYYGSMEALEAAFEQFLSRGTRRVIGADDTRLAQMASGLDELLTFGFSAEADVRASHIAHEAQSSRFRLVVGGREVDEIILQMPGRHKVDNALGAAAAAVSAGVSLEAVVKGLCSFEGIGRRFEYRGKFLGADLVDDYAHHPTEIEATLAAARWGPWKRIVAVFQPHLYSRTGALWREFGSALAGADVVVVTDVYGAREDPVPGITGKLVVEAVCEMAPSKRIAYAPDLEEAARFLEREVRPGDVVLSLGAGDIATLPGRLLGSGSGAAGPEAGPPAPEVNE